jgi:hypothetical protein
MLDEIERIAAAREKANPGESLSAKGMTIVSGSRGDVSRFYTPQEGGVFTAFHKKEFVLAAANLNWPRLVARLRALEEFITTCSYGWTGPQEGEPFMSFDRDKLDALRAALEAGKDHNAG